MPTDLLRLEVIDIILGDNGRLRARAAMRRRKIFPDGQLRRQRRGFHASSQCCGARDRTQRDFQKVPAFHDNPPR
jgi:hypothetical protein